MRVLAYEFSVRSILVIIGLLMQIGCEIIAVQDSQLVYRDVSELIPKEVQSLTYDEFVFKYNKREKSAYRQLLYYQNRDKINLFNNEMNQKFRMAVNEYSDLEEEQFRLIYATLVPLSAVSNLTDVKMTLPQTTTFPTLTDSSVLNASVLTSLSTVNALNISTKIDWTCYAGSIDSQGLCGSCYAFVAADTVSAHYAIQKNTINIKLSVQELISCNPPLLEDGCQGGLFQHSFQYIVDKGLTSSFVYPYVSAFITTAPSCILQTIANPEKWKISSYRGVVRDCDGVITELQRGPIAVGISSINLQFYGGGVYSGSVDAITDHAVLLIGYDPDIGFKIKNIWGKTWGILGYGWVDTVENAGLCSRPVTVQVPIKSVQLITPCA